MMGFVGYHLAMIFKKYGTMKSIVFVVVALAIVNLSAAQDNSQYRTQQYSDDGRYRPFQHEEATKYPPIYFKSFSVQPQDFHKLKLPILNYGKSSSEATASASSFSPVVIKPRSYHSPPKPIVIEPNYRPYYARNVNTESNAKIYRQESDIDANAYHYLYQTENGISAQESGRIQAPSSGTKVTGFYEYVGDDGVKYRVDYVADENGFQPRGAHLPQN